MQVSLSNNSVNFQKKPCVGPGYNSKINKEKSVEKKEESIEIKPKKEFKFPTAIVGWLAFLAMAVSSNINLHKEEKLEQQNPQIAVKDLKENFNKVIDEINTNQDDSISFKEINEAIHHQEDEGNFFMNKEAVKDFIEGKAE